MLVFLSRKRIITLTYQTLSKNTLTLFITINLNLLDAKKKEKELVEKSNISSLVKNSDLNTAEQNKIVKPHAYNLSCFLGKNVFGDGGFKICLLINQHLIH